MANDQLTLGSGSPGIYPLFGVLLGSGLISSVN